MKTLVHLAIAAALTLATATGTATVFSSPAAAATPTADQPWASVAYLINGQLVGGAQLYCDGSQDEWGNTTTYDTMVRTYFYMCP